MIHLSVIGRVMGFLILVIGVLMLTSLIPALIYGEGDAISILTSGLITILVGGILLLTSPRQMDKFTKRDGYLIVAMGWLLMVLFGMLPFLISGVIPSVPDALFETVSGMTTTGATVLEDIESAPKGILFWRSMTQWIGGMGIIVLTVAILPLLGIGGIELFVAEAPGPTSDKIHPRIQETAKRLWLIYVALTVLLMGILYFMGMTLYDAVNHALTTMATGGFSTKNASMAHYDTPWIQYPIIFFMFLAGTNYTVLYYGLKFQWQKVLKSDEYKLYITVLLVLFILFTFGIYWETGHNFEKAFRDGAFQVVSLITTTGYVSADYTQWAGWLTMVCFILMFMGACAGSTSGGIKLVRHLVFLKNSFREFKRILHPRAVIHLKMNKQVVAPRVVTHILVFLLIYLISFVFGSVIVMMLGLDFLTAIGAVATSLGNVGPGIGSVGPVDNFAHLPTAVKCFLAFLMLLGRLELFTILVLFTPYFWKLN